MKKFINYEKPLFEVIFFEQCDIVKTSSIPEGGGQYESNWDIFG